MRALPILAVPFILAVLATPASAHPVWVSDGPGVKDGMAYDVRVVRYPDINWNTKFIVYVSDIVTKELLERTEFFGADTFVDHPEEDLHEYVGDSIEAEVEFHVEGYQLGMTVYATGTFNGMTIRVEPDPLGIWDEPPIPSLPPLP